MAENATTEPVKMPGKYELIAELSKYFPTENASTIVATGDDAAVVEPDGNQMVTSSKVFVIGNAFIAAPRRPRCGTACQPSPLII